MSFVGGLINLKSVKTIRSFISNANKDSKHSKLFEELRGVG